VNGPLGKSSSSSESGDWNARNSYGAYLIDVVTIYLSMALQPFVGPWPLFQFLDLLHSR
jgi:hypothetical protein